MHNQNSLDTLAAALAYAMGIDAPKCAAEPNPELVEYIDVTLGRGGADRVFMYNPDAIGYTESTQGSQERSREDAISSFRSQP